jgi:carbonic anhydrase
MKPHRRSVLTGLLSAALCPICLAREAPFDEYAGPGPEWGYTGDTGPAHWGELSPSFTACSTGSQQSPIDLAGAIAGTPPKLDIEWQAFRSIVENNGHTIKVPVPAGSTVAEAGGAKFDLVEFHFHRPSEHEIGGRPFAMEAHFVHTNTKLGSAIVLGVFIQEAGTTENPVLQTIWDATPDKPGEPGKPIAIDPNRLLPGGRHRFRYAGSLTTPGCAETVNWNVFSQPIPASEAQVARFARWYRDNARPVRPAYRRVLLEEG